MSIEDLLNETGGMGKFQVAVITSLFFNMFITAWSMLQMSYAGFIPEFHCLGLTHISSDNETLNKCFLNINSTASCERYEFIGSSRTIVNEPQKMPRLSTRYLTISRTLSYLWNLVCDMKWVQAIVTSIQMAGVLVGSLISGQLGDYLGRKKTTYLFVVEHNIINIITAFSVNWQMFAVCRFFIGLGIGALLVAIFPYPLEFTPTKWRPVLAIIPVWCLGVAAAALAAFILDNWSHIHLACGVIGLVGVAGYFFVPESLRWLTVQGRVQEAEKIIAQIAKFNKKEVPTKTSVILQSVADEERKIRESGQKYTYIDVFRGWRVAKITLIFCYHWAVLACVYYGIAFGVASFSGNIQLNIFLLTIVELPATTLTFCLNNRIGRKWTSVIFMSLTALAAFICPIIMTYVQSGNKADIITGLCLTAKMGIGAAWASIKTWGTELYPTVTRNLGYGAANAASLIGAIIAPFVIDFENKMVASYIVIGSLSFVSVLLMLVTPETRGTELADSLTNVISDDHSKISDDNDRKSRNDTQDDMTNKYTTRL